MPDNLDPVNKHGLFRVSHEPPKILEEHRKEEDTYNKYFTWIVVAAFLLLGLGSLLAALHYVKFSQ